MAVAGAVAVALNGSVAMLAREDADELAELMDIELGDRESPAGDGRGPSPIACTTAAGGAAGGRRLQLLLTPARAQRPARRDAGPASLRRDAEPGRTGASTITCTPRTPMRARRRSDLRPELGAWRGQS